ncbi:hypothetical protein GDO81_010445 [Engystomops pustulosus]|uniref:Uncharacterized protein n=1 Tax=Engystomops pustulosus TaxID=76066 RepID=A0AAV7BZZ4_ENGPU|nr:hypothetical protein GDO81_010445 [Engystomops pustulosus]
MPGELESLTSFCGRAEAELELSGRCSCRGDMLPSPSVCSGDDSVLEKFSLFLCLLLAGKAVSGGNLLGLGSLEMGFLTSVTADVLWRNVLAARVVESAPSFSFSCSVGK